jgi:hypothetical protein
MMNQKDSENVDRNEGHSEYLAIEIDESGLTGLSALLTFPPSVPFVEGQQLLQERRSGKDRRVAERRARAEQYAVSE